MIYYLHVWCTKQNSYRFKLIPVSSHKIYAVLANLKMFCLTVINLKKVKITFKKL